jgi:hypothetical protein
MEFDDRKSSQEVAKSMRSAVLQTAAVGASAVGVGSALAVAASLDLTGLTGAGLIALSSLFVVPHQRNRLKRNLRNRINRLRKDLKESMTIYTQRELDMASHNFMDLISPYTKFVESEDKKLTKIEILLKETSKEIFDIRKEITELKKKIVSEKIRTKEEPQTESRKEKTIK